MPLPTDDQERQSPPSRSASDDVLPALAALPVPPDLAADGDQNAPQEAALVARLQSGDARAFEQLVREQGPRMLAVARRFLARDEDAQEAVQDAFLSAFRTLATFDQRSRLSTWLHRIVVNASLMKLRTQRRKPAVTLSALTSADGAGPESLDLRPVSRDGARTTPASNAGDDDAPLRAVLRQQMDALSDEYRTVLLLRDVEGLDTAQAATVLRISESAVKTRLHRARLALRKAVLAATGREDTASYDSSDEADTLPSGQSNAATRGGAQ